MDNWQGQGISFWNDTILKVFVPNVGFTRSSRSDNVQRFINFQPIRNHGGHLGRQVSSPDTFLEDDHVRSITSIFGSI